jgi:hypothetical protein
MFRLFHGKVPGEIDHRKSNTCFWTWKPIKVKLTLELEICMADRLVYDNNPVL